MNRIPDRLGTGFPTVWEQDSRTLGTTFPDAGDTIPSGREFFMNAVQCFWLTALRLTFKLG